MFSHDIVWNHIATTIFVLYGMVCYLIRYLLGIIRNRMSFFVIYTTVLFMLLMLLFLIFFRKEITVPTIEENYFLVVFYVIASTVYPVIQKAYNTCLQEKNCTEQHTTHRSGCHY